jgi:hypothetical protein
MRVLFFILALTSTSFSGDLNQRMVCATKMATLINSYDYHGNMDFNANIQSVDYTRRGVNMQISLYPNLRKDSIESALTDVFKSQCDPYIMDAIDKNEINDLFLYYFEQQLDTSRYFLTQINNKLEGHTILRVFPKYGYGTKISIIDTTTGNVVWNRYVFSGIASAVNATNHSNPEMISNDQIDRPEASFRLYIPNVSGRSARFKKFYGKYATTYVKTEHYEHLSGRQGELYGTTNGWRVTGLPLSDAYKVVVSPNSYRTTPSQVKRLRRRGYIPRTLLGK